jgi:hypothetical protein
MASILDKLKIKPVPKKRKAVEINVPGTEMREGVVLTTRMEDKRGESKIDRGAFMADFKNNLPVAEAQGDSLKPIYDLEPAQPVAQPNVVTVAPTPKKAAKKRRKKLVLIQEEEPGEEETKAPETVVIKRHGKRRITAPPITTEDFSKVVIGDQIIRRRLGKRPPHALIRRSEYYMNNRKQFINFVNAMFQPYSAELKEEAENEAKCDTAGSNDFEPMTHQKIIRDYVNMYTPYRGVMLYHGLGAGKTCSSIIVAEGLKDNNQIIIMTPASLRVNYVEELKKCGDHIYRKNQFWEFINTNDNPDLLPVLSGTLALPLDFIQRQGGAWLVNVKKPSNFDLLTPEQSRSIDAQINKMILQKYKFINYNGMRMDGWNRLVDDGEGGIKNPFDNATIIIDEVHNLISRIVNKIDQEHTLSYKIYSNLMNAKNARIILLTGTPIINQPNEIAIVFNILRGKIKTWVFKLDIVTTKTVDKETILRILGRSRGTKHIFDYVDYNSSTTTLRITRNPIGFYNSNMIPYDGVHLQPDGNMSDGEFVANLTNTLAKHKINIKNSATRIELYKALPDNKEVFNNMFIDDNFNIKNADLLKRRIIGLTSYFRDIEKLMPVYDRKENFYEIKIEMSSYQFGVYEQARVAERKLESMNKKKKKKKQGKNMQELYNDSISNYRIFSRMFCNFVFPRDSNIQRPMPNDNDDIETAIDNGLDEDTIDDNKLDGLEETDEALSEEKKDSPDRSTPDRTYDDRIYAALEYLYEHREEYLTPEGLQIYSPKFLNILENVSDPNYAGSHLIYTQFRKLEGIGILRLILKTNGFAEFDIIKNKGTGEWTLNIAAEDMDKPKFVLYTGTETAEKKELVRNIFNSNWGNLQQGLVNALHGLGENNFMGGIIKIFMITASGAEGISLKNVRYVHLTEPYWHPVRLEQVIGRARRICSHKDLPKELQTVEVFLYLMTFTEAQMSGDEARELKKHDKGKITPSPLTSDEALYEISTIKENINKKILVAVKESAIDCALQDNAKEGLRCYAFSEGDSGDPYSYKPSYENEELDTSVRINKKQITWTAVEMKYKGVKYALNQETNIFYTLASYLDPSAELIRRGRLIKREGKKPKVELD